MILPGSPALAIAILIFSMICWGLWPNTIKLAPKWRFELFYLDFALGVAVAAVIAALTFGSMGWDGFSVMDDLRLAGKRNDLFVFLAGCIFNLGNMLLVAAISIGGISFSVPIAMGTALVVSSGIGFAAHREGSLAMFAVGCVATIAAVVLGALAYKDRTSARTRKSFSNKGVILALIGGLFIGCFVPLLTSASNGEDGLGPYSAALTFAFGLFVSTVIFSLFFINLPVQGRPVEVSGYIRGGLRPHMNGFFGGVVWLVGMVAVLVAARADAGVRPKASLQFLVPQFAPLIAFAFGVLIWKEMMESGSRGRTFAAAMVLLYAAGVSALTAAIY